MTLNVMTLSYDVTYLTHDVIRIAVRNLIALCTLNIISRYTLSPSSKAELHGKHDGNNFMSLRCTVFLISACKVQKVPISRQFDLWPAIIRSHVDLRWTNLQQSWSTCRCAYARFYREALRPSVSKRPFSAWPWPQVTGQIWNVNFICWNVYHSTRLGKRNTMLVKSTM